MRIGATAYYTIYNVRIGATAYTLHNVLVHNNEHTVQSVHLRTVMRFLFLNMIRVLDVNTMSLGLNPLD